MFSVEFRYRARKIYKSVKQIVELVSNVLLFLASFLAIILVIYRFGFDMPADYSHEIYYTYRAIIRLFVVLGLLRFLFNFRLLRAEKGFWIEVLVLLFLFALTLFSKHFDRPDFEETNPFLFKVERISDVCCGITIEYHTTLETDICCLAKSGKGGSSFCREFFIYHPFRGCLVKIT